MNAAAAAKAKSSLMVAGVVASITGTLIALVTIMVGGFIAWGKFTERSDSQDKAIESISVSLKTLTEATLPNLNGAIAAVSSRVNNNDLRLNMRRGEIDENTARVRDLEITESSTSQKLSNIESTLSDVKQSIVETNRLLQLRGGYERFRE